MKDVNQISWKIIEIATIVITTTAPRQSTLYNPFWAAFQVKRSKLLVICLLYVTFELLLSAKAPKCSRSQYFGRFLCVVDFDTINSRRSNTWRHDAIKMKYPLEKKDPMYYLGHAETNGMPSCSIKGLESDIWCVVEIFLSRHSRWWVKKHPFTSYRSAPTKLEDFHRV